MKQQWINRIAGIFILTGAILGHFVNENFYFIDVFVGFNLLQTSFTNWCLLGDILAKFGIQD